MRAENANLRDKLANLQLNFEVELSRRLDSESKAQTVSQSYKNLLDAYNTLQLDTTRLFQLAMSELAELPASQEKLQRRFEELRAASQVTQVRASEGGIVTTRNTAGPATSTVRGAARRKDEQSTAMHKKSVEAINSELNKLLTSMSVAANGSSAETSSRASGSSSSSEPQWTKLWRSVGRAEHFAEYCEPAGKRTDVEFCRAVFRLLNAPADARESLVESVLVDHLDADCNWPVTLLPKEARAEIRGCLALNPDDLDVWRDALTRVEAGLLADFTVFAKTVVEDDTRRRTSTAPSHQIVLR